MASCNYGDDGVKYEKDTNNNADNNKHVFNDGMLESRGKRNVV